MNKFVRHLLLSALVLVIVMVGGTLAYASNNLTTQSVQGVPMSQPIPQIASVDGEWDRSSVSVTGACVDGVPTFYVSNTGEAGEGDMDAPTTWRLVDADGNILASGTIQVAGGDTQTLSFPEYAGQTVRLYVDQRPGHPGSSNPNHVVENCGDAPTPTEEPTEVVTEEPTDEPTEVVTEEPTEEPTEVVTEEPTEEPTEIVTEEPTPVVTPTEEPTVVPAVFDASIECNLYGGITYTVYLVEGEMADGEYYAVYYTNMYGWGVNVGFVEWLNDYNSSISFEVYDVSATTFWVDGLDHLTRSVACSDVPELSVNAECYYNEPTFYIYNIGSGNMSSSSEWTLYDSYGNWLTSGSVYLYSGDIEVLSFPEYADLELTLYVQQPPEYSSDSYAVASIASCLEATEEPVTVELASYIECGYYGGIIFTVYITQGEMNYGEYYPVYYTNADGWDVLVGFVEWLSPYNSSVSFDVYDVTSTTFWVDGYDSLNLSIDCSAPTEEPTEVVTEEPTEEPTPVVTPTEEPTEEPTPVVTPTEEPTEEPTPVVTPTPEPTPTDEVWDKSSVEVTGECLNGIPTFYVTNTGEEGMTGETTWRLTDVSTGEIIASGTIILAGFETQWLQFPEYSDRILRLNVDQRPGHPGNSNPNAVVGTCYVPTPEPTPELEPVDFVTSATCANNGTITFTVTYTGTGAMAQGESYTVRYTTGDLTDDNPEDDVFVTLGTVSRLSQSRPTATFTVRRMSGQTVTFVVDGMPILTTTVDCWDKSSVSVSGQCVNGVPVFNVNNTGTEGMTGDTEWRLIDVQTGAILTSGTIRLGGNETQQLSFAEYASLNIRLYVDQRPGHPGSSQPTDSLNNCANS